ncbi:MAG TPA: Rid family detoxifying hydrolase [Chitinophagaceae bacterium]|nr:Rid family detoxifying hydrolase [Chitinophagaceae bacterium]
MLRFASFFFATILFINTMAQSSLPLSSAISQNDLLFISGQVGIDPSIKKLQDQNFEAEMKQVMHNIGSILAEHHLGFADLVNVTIYLKDMQHYETVNRVYASYFSGRFPARVCLAVNDLPSNANVEIAAVAAQQKSPKEIVEAFLKEVRSGSHPERANLYMADTVLAHQVTSENPTTVHRTPANYAAHVNEFLGLFGKFELSVTELLADGDKVYARWVQRGTHQADLDEHKATGLPLVEFTSAVYRVEKGKIVEYWLQSDRLGLDEQLKRNAIVASEKPAVKK